MAKFRKDGKKVLPAISTASLPDIVFMLLFFFMVVTTMREQTLKVKRPRLPEGTEIKKLENKSLISYIYVGVPKDEKQGTASRIQLNDQLADVDDIPMYIEGERELMGPAKATKMVTALKVDSDTKMGIVVDIKQELRKVHALKINYSPRKKSVEK